MSPGRPTKWTDEQLRKLSMDFITIWQANPGIKKSQVLIKLAQNDDYRGLKWRTLKRLLFDNSKVTYQIARLYIK